MVTRREELRSNLNSGRKIPSLVDDLTMRHYIAVSPSPPHYLNDNVVLSLSLTTVAFIYSVLCRDS